MRGRAPLRAAFLMSAIVCLPAAVLAQWEVAGYVGAAHTQNSTLFLNQPALGTNLIFRDVGYHGESFTSPWYYGVRGGYFFHHFGAETEFIHAKVFTNTRNSVPTAGEIHGAAVNATAPMSDFVQRYSLSHGMNLLLENLVARKEWWRDSEDHGRLQLAARVGVGLTIPHAESIIGGISNQHYQLADAAFQLAGGGELRLWRRVYWLGEYKYTRCDEKVDVFGGTMKGLLHSHHLITGISLHL